MCWASFQQRIPRKTSNLFVVQQYLYSHSAAQVPSAGGALDDNSALLAWDCCAHQQMWSITALTACMQQSAEACSLVPSDAYIFWTRAAHLLVQKLCRFHLQSQ